MICPICSGTAVIERREGGKAFEVQCRKCKQWFKMKTILIPFDPEAEYEDEIPLDIHIRKPILDFALRMEQKMSEKDEVYGDREQRLEQEIEEYREKVKYRGGGTAESLAEEMVDFANISMMIWNRLKEGEEDGKMG